MSTSKKVTPKRDDEGVVLHVLRTFADVVEAFRAVNDGTASGVRDVVLRTAQFIQSGDHSINALKKELAGVKVGVMTVGHVASIQISAAIYRANVGALAVAPANVLTMAARMQKVYGIEAGIKRVSELAKVRVPDTDSKGKPITKNGKPVMRALTFAEWSAKKDGKSLYVPTEGEHKAAQAAKSGGKKSAKKDGKKDGAQKSITVRNLDDVVLGALQILKKNTEWRTTSQPDAVAELSAILNSVTTADAAK